MTEPIGPSRYLELEDLLALIRDLGVGPIRDLGLLAAAAARPTTSLYGNLAYPEVAQQAAALLHSLARNHALVDGNKRLAFLACLVFLHLNGFETGLDEDSAYQLVIDVAVGAMDVPEIARGLRIRSHHGGITE